MKLRERLMLSTVVPIALVGAAVVGTVFFGGVSVMSRMTVNTFQDDVKNAMNSLDKFFFERLGNLEVLSKVIENEARHGNYVGVEKRLYEFRNVFKAYQSLAFYDADGVKKVDTNRVGIGKKYQFSFWNRLLKSDQATFEFYFDRDLNSRGVLFAHRIEGDAQKPIGIVVGVAPMAAIYQITKDLDSGVFVDIRRRVDLLKMDGEVLYSNHIPNAETGPWAVIDSASRDRLAKFIKQDIVTTAIEDSSSIQVMARPESFLGFAQQNWVMVVAADKDQIFAEVYRLGVWLGGIFLVLVGAMIGLSYLLSKSVIRPIEDVADKTKQIADGNFDVFSGVEPTSDEAGVLVEQIHQMAQKLKVTIGELNHRERITAIGQMAGGVAHEINNPLMIITGQSEMLGLILEKEPHANPRVNEAARKIESTAIRIAKIIRGLRALSRDGGHDPFVVTSVSSVVENTMEMCRQNLGSLGIDLRLMVPDPSPILECRPVQVSQILLNLINFAKDSVALANDRWIVLAVSETPTDVLFTIKNSGPRVSNDLGDRLFQPQANLRQDGRVIGLSLSISQALAQAHHGTLELDRKSAVTTFVLTLPKSQSNQTISKGNG